MQFQRTFLDWEGCLSAKLKQGFRLAVVFSVVVSTTFVSLGQAQEESSVKTLKRPGSGESGKADESKSDSQSAKDKQEKDQTADTKKQVDSKNKAGWIPLLPKQGLKGWKVTEFGIPAEVKRDGDMLLIEMGDPLNGVTSEKKDFPTDNFEISLEANRMEGSDFLVGLTFPVGKEFCSFIAGGWGGSLVGLSSVDDFDASENQTTTYFEFENNKWYRFRVRVEKEYIRAWIDDEEFFRQERDGHEFSTRIEVYGSQPLGLCSFMSKVGVRDFKYRKLGKTKKPDEKKKKEESASGAGNAVEPIQ